METTGEVQELSFQFSLYVLGFFIAYRARVENQFKVAMTPNQQNTVSRLQKRISAVLVRYNCVSLVYKRKLWCLITSPKGEV